MNVRFLEDNEDEDEGEASPGRLQLIMVRSKFLDPKFMSARFMVDLLRYCCFRKEPSSNSWEFAGVSNLLREFADRLYIDWYPDISSGPTIPAEPVDNGLEETIDRDDEEEDESAPDAAVSKWVSGTTDSKGVKLIFLHDCAMRAKQGEPWNPGLMVSECLKTAIQSYNSDTTVVTGKRKIRITADLLTEASKTATNTWLAAVVQGSRQGVTDPPTLDYKFKDADFFTRMLGDTKDIQKKWQEYFYYHLNTAKITAPKTGPKINADSSAGAKRKDRKRKSGDQNQTIGTPAVAPTSGDSPPATGGVASTLSTYSDITNKCNTLNEALNEKILIASQTAETQHIEIKDALQDVSRNINKMTDVLTQFLQNSMQNNQQQQPFYQGHMQTPQYGQTYALASSSSTHVMSTPRTITNGSLR
jgi:hypothetical protein